MWLSKPHALYKVDYDGRLPRYIKLVPENVAKARKGDWKMQRYVAIAYFYLLSGGNRNLPSGWDWRKHSIKLVTNAMSE